MSKQNTHEAKRKRREERALADAMAEARPAKTFLWRCVGDMLQAGWRYDRMTKIAEALKTLGSEEDSEIAIDCANRMLINSICKMWDESFGVRAILEKRAPERFLSDIRKLWDIRNMKTSHISSKEHKEVISKMRITDNQVDRVTVSVDDPSFFAETLSVEDVKVLEMVSRQAFNVAVHLACLDFKPGDDWRIPGFKRGYDLMHMPAMRGDDGGIATPTVFNFVWGKAAADGDMVFSDE